MMRAYKQGVSKKEFVAELVAHQKADNFLRGSYWTGSKGCAVGCSLESVGRLKGVTLRKEDHSLYPVYLGVPEWLARLEDTIFEGISTERSKTWPVEFAKTIRVGANLEKAKVPFLVMVTEHSITSMDSAIFDAKKYPATAGAIKGSRAAVKQVIKAQKSGDAKKIELARSAARSAAYSADSAAYSADSVAYSARSAARSAAYSADSAAYSAARSAAYSADSAAYSAYSAARSADLERSAADSARSADSAARSARTQSFEYYANRLLEILKETK